MPCSPIFMRKIEVTTAFKQDFKRGERSASGRAGYRAATDHHRAGDRSAASTRYRDHALGSNWKGYRDCHVRPDLVLIYRLDPERLILARLGSRSELNLLTRCATIRLHGARGACSNYT